MHDKRLVRIDASRLEPREPQPFPVRIFANEQVAVESTAVDELFSVFTSNQDLQRLSAPDARFERVAVTPDFHKGAGVPIGTILETRGVLFPQAVGNDINCGMRLHTTNLDAQDVSTRVVPRRNSAGLSQFSSPPPPGDPQTQNRRTPRRRTACL